MQTCVYSANFSVWLKFMHNVCGPVDIACFRSNRRWATAKDILDRNGPMPILIRDTDDKSTEFRCTRLAELVGIYFPEDIGGKRKLTAWAGIRRR